METVPLGRSGIRVTPLALGTVNFGPWGNSDTEDCGRIINAALDAGINFIDTADVYGDGGSEEMLGRCLGRRREEVVLASKFGTAGGPVSGGSRVAVHRAVDASLRRLRTDWIDVYLMHRPDPDTDVDETLGALSDLVRTGKVRAIGTSGFRPEDIVEAQWLARARSRERFSVDQPLYSIFAREPERGVIPTCVRYGLGVIAAAPLNGGWLTGKYRRGGTIPPDSRANTWPKRRDRWDLSRPETGRKLDLVEELAVIAADAGMSLPSLAIGFVLSRPGVTSALLGPRTMDHLEDLLRRGAQPLDPEILKAIDEVVRPGETVDPEDALPYAVPSRPPRCAPLG